jgi:hypothetical protein
MYSRYPKNFRNEVNEAFAIAIKHKRSEHFIEEQKRENPIMMGVFNKLQKELLPKPEELKKLLMEKTFKEFDKEKFIRERDEQASLEERLTRFYSGTNLLSTIMYIQERNLSMFKESFKKVACDEKGNLKKAILHNSSEIQPEILSQFVIQELEEGDVFSFKKVKKVNLEATDCEEEEDSEYDFDDEDLIQKVFETKEDLLRREKRDKIIQSCKSYVYLRENPKLFTKEEMETLRRPNIEGLSEENFQ